MKTVSIRKGRNIPLKGSASLDLLELPFPGEVSVPFFEFRPRQFRLLVKEGDALQVGSPLAQQREGPPVILASPVSGTVKSVNRGEKRSLVSVTILTDGRQTQVIHPVQPLADMTKVAVIELLLKSGVWPFVRQRPFSKIADPLEFPKSIFIHAMNTNPLAPSMDVILKGAGQEFQAGIEVLRRLTPGPVYLTVDAGTPCELLKNAKNVEIVGFTGPHPTGNVGTHIHNLDPIGKGDLVWFIEAQDVLRFGHLFTRGVFDPRKVIAVTGENAGRRVHVATVLGATAGQVLGEAARDDTRYISGSVLSGIEIGHAGSIGFYDAQLTAIPAGGERKFFGWLGPRLDDYTFSRLIAGGVHRHKEYSLDSDMHGGVRAVVLNDVYDDLNTLDILTYFLIKAIYVGDIQEMMRLGILECAPADFALCSFACPSKVDVMGMIRKGMDVMEKEGLA